MDVHKVVVVDIMTGMSEREEGGRNKYVNKIWQNMECT